MSDWRLSQLRASCPRPYPPSAAPLFPLQPSFHRKQEAARLVSALSQVSSAPSNDTHCSPLTDEKTHSGCLGERLPSFADPLAQFTPCHFHSTLVVFLISSPKLALLSSLTPSLLRLPHASAQHSSSQIDCGKLNRLCVCNLHAETQLCHCGRF